MHNSFYRWFLACTWIWCESLPCLLIRSTTRSTREYIVWVEVLTVGRERRKGKGDKERQGWTRRLQVHIGEGVAEQCAHSMRTRYDYRKPSRNYFLYIENARGPSPPPYRQKLSQSIPPPSSCAVSPPPQPPCPPSVTVAGVSWITRRPFSAPSVVLLTCPDSPVDLPFSRRFIETVTLRGTFHADAFSIFKRRIYGWIVRRISSLKIYTLRILNVFWITQILLIDN